ncbi:MAG TPA: substrate-binding domain-containing protein [Mycobacterium sp.]|nr:substrate-binding domain-containing protein [Mycobacterium sp.]
MKHSRLTLIAAVTLAVAATVSGCASSGGSSTPADRSDCQSGKGAVGYIPKLGTDPYMVTVHNAADAAAAKIGGKVIYTSPSDATGAAQIPFVNQLISQRVCVIAISGSDLNSTAAALAKAKAAGIKVLSWDSDIATSSRSLFINQAKTAELGSKMLDSMSGLLGPSGGDFAVLSSTQTAVNQNAWIANMKSRLASDPKLKNLHLVAVAYGQEKADVNAQQAKALVQAYPKLKGIIVPAGIGLPAAAQALSQIGALGKVKLTGLAPASLIKNYIMTGNVQDIWWNVSDLGTLSYYAAQALAEGKITGATGETFTAGELGTFTVGANGEVILGSAQVVTPANVDQFKF